MTAWITGCSGFLGRRLAKAWKQRGFTVVGISRTYAPEADRWVQADLVSDRACEDLTSELSKFGRPEVVVHAAARLDREPGTFRQFIDANVVATANLLEALKDSPPSHLIYMSTLSVYGKPDRVPVSENDSPLSTHPYSVTKTWAEQLCLSFRDETPVTVLRLPSLYGKGQRDSFVDGLAQRALRGETIELFGRGDLARDAMHVQDAVDAIMACASIGAVDCGRLNLGCGRKTTILEYANSLVKALGSASQVLHVDRPPTQGFDLYADISKARRTIGFEPTPLAESMERYAAELRA